MRACDLVVNPDRSDPNWCDIVDRALDDYDNSSRQVQELTEKENSEVKL